MDSELLKCSDFKYPTPVQMEQNCGHCGELSIRGYVAGATYLCLTCYHDQSLYYYYISQWTASQLFYQENTDD